MNGARGSGRSRRLRVGGLVCLLIVVGGAISFGAVQYGKRQLWETEVVRAGWRVDRHVLNRRCRLADPDGWIESRGMADDCLDALDRTQAAAAKGGQDRHLVILLHGLGRSASSFQPMARALRREGFDAVAVSYPSLKRPVADHADQIARIVERARGVDRVSFVTHSLGGIIVRELLSRETPWASNSVTDRVVMIAPPNQGSALARDLSQFCVFDWIAGPSGLDLAGDDVAQLPPPPVPFGIIVGRSAGDPGFNPWLEGNDDGVVSLAETRLAGSRDTLVVQAVHSFIMSDPQTVAATGRFLKTGQFDSHLNH